MSKNETSLVVKNLEKSMRAGSLKDLMRVKDSGNVNLLLDCSGSMDATMRNGKRRIEGLRAVVKDLQAKKPTTMIAFGPTFGEPIPQDPNTFNPYLDDAPQHPAFEPVVVAFVDAVPEPSGGTPLAQAIRFARTQGAGRLLVISDGEPADARDAMAAAREFGGRIDVVYVGDPGGAGSFFLDELAKMTGGQRFEGDLAETKEIGVTIMGLLTGDVLEEVDEDDDDDDDDDDDLDDDDDEDDEENEA